MCGRFSLHSDRDKILKQFSLLENQALEFKPSYNIAPSQLIYVICEIPNKDGKISRIMTTMQWGFIPFWSKEKSLTGIINARLETIDNKPAFKQAFKQHRCLIIADGFYEWKPKSSYKQPYYICTKDHSLFAMAGIWSRWKGEKETVDSCAILTIEANKVLDFLHARMPALISSDGYSKWLEPNYRNIEALKLLAKTYPVENLDLFPVDRKVNNFRYNNVDCVKPVSGKE